MQPDLREALRNAGVPEDRMDAVLRALPRPDPDEWNSDPGYLRALLERVGLSQVRAAQLTGISPRQYCAGKREAPYTVQFALEVLALLHIPENDSLRESDNDQT